MKKKITHHDHKFTLNGIRKRFSSIDEIKQYIIDENILPQKTTDNDGNPIYQKYYIIEKLEKTHELTLDQPIQKSDELVRKFIDKAISRIESMKHRDINGETNSIVHGIQYQLNPPEKHTWVTKPNAKFVEKYSKLFQRKIDYTVAPKGFISFIIDLLKSYDDIFYAKDVDLTRIYTDYKPCNGICIKFNKDFGNFYIILRDADVVISTHNVYGRNVHIRNERAMKESDLNDF